MSSNSAYTARHTIDQEQGGSNHLVSNSNVKMSQGRDQRRTAGRRSFGNVTIIFPNCSRGNCDNPPNKSSYFFSL